MGWWGEKIPALKEAVDTEKIKRDIAVRSVCIHGEDNCVRCASTDFDSQTESSTNWQALDDDDIKRVVYILPDKVTEMMRRYPGEVVLAGGFIRSVIGREMIHDADIFVKSESKAKTYTNVVGLEGTTRDKNITIEPGKHNDMEIQVIWRYPYEHPYNILEGFDYTTVKAAIWFDEGDKNRKPNFVSICHERFYRDLARKLLVCDCERNAERVQSIPRLLKYISYGYSIDPKNLAEVVVKTCLSLDLTNGFEGMLKHLEEAYNLVGSGKESWEKMTKKHVPPKPKPKLTPRDYTYDS